MAGGNGEVGGSLGIGIAVLHRFIHSLRQLGRNGGGNRIVEIEAKMAFPGQMMAVVFVVGEDDAAGSEIEGFNFQVRPGDGRLVGRPNETRFRCC